MMKKIFLYLIIGGLMGSLISCEKFLTIEPAQEISEDLVLTTDRNVKNVLNGAYGVINGPFLYGGGALTLSELLASDGEIHFSGTYMDLREIATKQISVTNSDVSNLWMRAYYLINIVNNVLDAIEVVNTGDQARVEGEALFLRSLAHYDLVRYFGQAYDAALANNTQLGVPLMLKPSRGITDESFVSRNTVQDVYGKVIEDLERAASLLPDQSNEANIAASKGAANALLARVYLHKGDYVNARIKANAVIASNNYTLRPTYAAVFNNDNKSTEDIFVAQITSQDRFSAMTEFWSVQAFGGRDGDVDILPGHLDLYPAGDARHELFFFGSGAMRSGKWNNRYGVVHILRLAEMHLIRAEGNIRLGAPFVGPNPKDDINALRQRAGLSGDALYESVTIEDVLLERRLELAHEGHKIFDIKRLKGTVGELLYSDPKVLFPIPFRETQINPNLEQNPTYN